MTILVEAEFDSQLKMNFFADSLNMFSIKRVERKIAKRYTKWKGKITKKKARKDC